MTTMGPLYLTAPFLPESRLKEENRDVVVAEHRCPVAVVAEIEPNPARVTVLYRKRDVHSIEDPPESLRGCHLKAVLTCGECQVRDAQFHERVSALSVKPLASKYLRSTEYDWLP